MRRSPAPSPASMLSRTLRAAAVSAGACAAWAGIPVAVAEPLLISVPDSASQAAVGDSEPSPSAMTACEPAIRAAAAAHDIPTDLMLAIGMVESGLSPWVLNAEGTPHFFDDGTSAESQLEALLGDGVESVDVGCMQVNMRWHPDAFPDAATAIDPAANADYAAKFLLSLFAMTGSWTDAVAYYHSSAQRYQRPYVCAVAARLDELGSAVALDCLPADAVDLPQVAAGTPSTAADVPSGPSGGAQRMLRIAPASGSGPTVVRGQEAPPDATDSAGPRQHSGPRIIRVQ